MRGAVMFGPGNLVLKSGKVIRKRCEARMLSTGGFRATHLRRSVLYMPASNDRAVARIPTLDADSFILDLEDAVMTDMKPLARSKAVQATIDHRKVEEGLSEKELVIRINGFSTEWFKDDLEAVLESNAHALLVPKVEHADDILRIEERIKQSHRNDLRIWCMIETPLGILNVDRIASCSDTLDCLVAGTVDLANDMHCLPSAPERWNLQFALSKIVTSARAFQKLALDGVYINIKDDEGFKRECIQGRQLGFDGKTLIHPRTIAAANAAFSPTESEILHSKRIIQAQADAVAHSKGVITLDGKLVEALHLKEAARLLDMYDRIQKAK